MSKKFEISVTCSNKEMEMVFLDTPTEVQVAKFTNVDGKKGKEVITSFDKERIPELIKWLKSLSPQLKLGM